VYLDGKLTASHTLEVRTDAPHRRNRRRPKTQDVRAPRRYRRRWKVERTFAWLYNFRRWDRYATTYLALLHAACVEALQSAAEKRLESAVSKARDGT